LIFHPGRRACTLPLFTITVAQWGNASLWWREISDVLKMSNEECPM